MINQLRTEAQSGSIDDLAHVVSQDCLADPLTKSSAKADFILNSLNTGKMPNVDKHPPFRELMQNRHKAYGVDALAEWLVYNVPAAGEVMAFLGVPVARELYAFLQEADWYTYQG